MSIGGEALASVATDDDGYFNYSSYRQSALRLLRVRLDASLRLGAHAAVLGEARADNGYGFSLSALYLRLRPWRDHALDLQAGRIPPTFGAFARRGYGSDNPLIGVPLAYQYLTSLRADSLPATTDDLLRMRGRGYRTSYPLGSQMADVGLPLVAIDRWDVGAELRLGVQPVSLAVAVTNGSLSDPRVHDDNDGKQVSGRVELRPAMGLILGASASRGQYLSRDATLPAEAQRDGYTQKALGFDFEYSRGYWLGRGEAILSAWSVPRVADSAPADALKATAVFVEGRYKIRPGLYAALRLDHLGFGRIAGSLSQGRPPSWDAPVSRVEVGGGLSLRRNVQVKAVYQHDWRAGTPYPSADLVGAQALLWF